MRNQQRACWVCEGVFDYDPLANLLIQQVTPEAGYWTVHPCELTSGDWQIEECRCGAPVYKRGADGLLLTWPAPAIHLHGLAVEVTRPSLASDRPLLIAGEPPKRSPSTLSLTPDQIFGRSHQ